MTVYLEREVFSLLERKAKETGQSLSKVVRAALLEHLKDEKRRQARQKLLEMVKARKKDEAIWEAWREYERTGREATRNFEELFLENGA